MALQKMTSILLISLKTRMPLGDDVSNTMHCPLLETNSTMNLSSGVVTAGVSAQASRHVTMAVMWLPYNQSNSILHHTNTVQGLHAS